MIGPIGCGGDDEEKPPAPTATSPAETATAPVVTTPPSETVPVVPPGKGPNKGKPNVPSEGNAGDEEETRSEAVFTGRDDEITPSVVRVPAFIAVRVIFRSADKSDYLLVIKDKHLVATAGKKATLDLPGLLPGKAYEGSSPSGTVRIEATAEPGP